MIALTERQRVLLEFIEAHFAEHGVGPTQREMGDAIGAGKHYARPVYSALHKLKARGAIDWTPYDRRGVLPRFRKCPCCGEFTYRGGQE